MLARSIRGEADLIQLLNQFLNLCYLPMTVPAVDVSLQRSNCSFAASDLFSSTWRSIELVARRTISMANQHYGFPTFFDSFSCGLEWNRWTCRLVVILLFCHWTFIFIGEQTMFMWPFSCHLKIEKEDIEQRRRGIEETTYEQIFLFGQMTRVLYRRLSFQLPCSIQVFILDVLHRQSILDSFLRIISNWDASLSFARTRRTKMRSLPISSWQNGLIHSLLLHEIDVFRMDGLSFGGLNVALIGGLTESIVMEFPLPLNSCANVDDDDSSENNVFVTELNEIETRESLSSVVRWKTKKGRRLRGTRRTNGERSMDEIIARCEMNCPFSDGIEKILVIWTIPFEIVESKLFETLTSLTFSSSLAERSEKVSQWEGKGSRDLSSSMMLTIVVEGENIDLVFDRHIRWKKLFDALRRTIHLFNWHNVSMCRTFFRQINSVVRICMTKMISPKDHWWRTLARQECSSIIWWTFE